MVEGWNGPILTTRDSDAIMFCWDLRCCGGFELVDRPQNQRLFSPLYMGGMIASKNVPTKLVHVDSTVNANCVTSPGNVTGRCGPGSFILPQCLAGPWMLWPGDDLSLGSHFRFLPKDDLEGFGKRPALK